MPPKKQEKAASSKVKEDKVCIYDHHIRHIHVHSLLSLLVDLRYEECMSFSPLLGEGSDDRDNNNIPFKIPPSLTHPHHIEKQIRPSQKTSRADPSSTGSGGQVTGDARKGEREGVKGERGGGAEEEGEGAGGVVEACASAESAVWGGPEDDFVCVF